MLPSSNLQYQECTFTAGREPVRVPIGSGAIIRPQLSKRILAPRDITTVLGAGWEGIYLRISYESLGALKEFLVFLGILLYGSFEDHTCVALDHNVTCSVHPSLRIFRDQLSLNRTGSLRSTAKTASGPATT